MAQHRLTVKPGGRVISPTSPKQCGYPVHTILVQATGVVLAAVREVVERIPAMGTGLHSSLNLHSYHPLSVLHAIIRQSVSAVNSTIGGGSALRFLHSTRRLTAGASGVLRKKPSLGLRTYLNTRNPNASTG